MFLQSEDHDINDFLSAVNFIAPQGFNLKYFILNIYFYIKDYIHKNLFLLYIILKHI